MQALGYPTDYIDRLSVEQVAERIGTNIPQGGWWFVQVGWVAPPDICRANLVAAGAVVDARWNTRVELLRQDGDRWAALDTHQNVTARVPVIVLINSLGAVRLAPPTSASFKPVCGQLISVPVTALQTGAVWSEAVVCGGGYFLPTG